MQRLQGDNPSVVIHIKRLLAAPEEVVTKTKNLLSGPTATVERPGIAGSSFPWCFVFHSSFLTENISSGA